MTPAEQLVNEILAAQRAKGRAKYGKGLDHTEGRDWNHMALEELADAVQYLAAENVRLRGELASRDVAPGRCLSMSSDNHRCGVAAGHEGLHFALVVTPGGAVEERTW